MTDTAKFRLQLETWRDDEIRLAKMYARSPSLFAEHRAAEKAYVNAINALEAALPAEAPPARYRRVGNSIVPAEGKDWPPILRDNKCPIEFLDKIIDALNVQAQKFPESS